MNTNTIPQLEVMIARIDERVNHIQNHFATKEDLLGVKLWVVGGVIGGIVTAAGLVLLVLRLFIT